MVSVDVCLEKRRGYLAEKQVKNVLRKELEREICPRSALDCSSEYKLTVKLGTQL